MVVDLMVKYRSRINSLASGINKWKDKANARLISMFHSHGERAGFPGLPLLLRESRRARGAVLMESFPGVARSNDVVTDGIVGHATCFLVRFRGCSG